jgi:hypothetical protein
VYLQRSLVQEEVPAFWAGGRLRALALGDVVHVCRTAHLTATSRTSSCARARITHGRVSAHEVWRRGRGAPGRALVGTPTPTPIGRRGRHVRPGGPPERWNSVRFAVKFGAGWSRRRRRGGILTPRGVHRPDQVAVSSPSAAPGLGGTLASGLREPVTAADEDAAAREGGTEG